MPDHSYLSDKNWVDQNWIGGHWADMNGLATGRDTPELTEPWVNGPMAVLSAAPLGSGWRVPSVLGAAAAQGLILAALFGGTPNTLAPADPAPIEMFEVAPEPRATQETPPPELPEITVALATPPEPPAALPSPEPPAALPSPEPLAALRSPEPPVALPSPGPPPKALPEPLHLETTRAEDEIPAPPMPIPPVEESPPPPRMEVSPATAPAMPDPVRPPPPRRAEARTSEARPVPRQQPPPPLFHAPVRQIPVPRDPAQRPTPWPAAPAGGAQARSAEAAAARPPTLAPHADRRAEDILRNRIRDAVQAAVRCPAAARMMGLSGRAGIAFDYRDGAITGAAQITRSAGVPLLDQAALAAVREARFPKAPPDMATQVLRLLIWVEEACGG